MASWVPRLVLVALLCAAGCAAHGSLVPGRSTEADVRAAMGVPAETRAQPGGEKVLWYPLPIPDSAYGYEAYAARIAGDGTLVSLEQRLTPENISKLRPESSTAEDVRDTIGPPFRAYPLTGKPGEVWEYRLQGFQRPVTLYVQLTPDRIVSDVYLLERRGTSSRPQRHLR